MRNHLKTAGEIMRYIESTQNCKNKIQKWYLMNNSQNAIEFFIITFVLYLIHIKRGRNTDEERMKIVKYVWIQILKDGIK